MFISAKPGALQVIKVKPSQVKLLQSYTFTMPEYKIILQDLVPDKAVLWERLPSS